MKFKLLGSAAGGGIPQWNCACKLCHLARTNPSLNPPRMQLQAAIAELPGEWFLVNASPDLRFQIEANPELHPAPEKSKRNTPICGVVLTTADLDQVLGLLLLREFQPLTLYATELVRQVLLANSFFRMLERVPGQLTWKLIEPGFPFSLGESITCTPFSLSASLPFYARHFDSQEHGGAGLGLIFEGASRRIAYTPSLPEITDELVATYETCDFILVDGTFWSDEELSRTHSGTPRARAIGHVPMSGPDGTNRFTLVSLAAQEDLCSSQQHQSRTRLAKRRIPTASRRRMGDRSRRMAIGLTTEAPPRTGILTREELRVRLQEVGEARYHHRHPFHLRMHKGELTRGQLQAWALNRYYYQSRIPIKDALLLARSDDPAFRRAWRKRILDHDGDQDGYGGIEKWIQLAEAAGLDREYVIGCTGILPGVAFAVDAYLALVRDSPLLIAVASSLTELFSRDLISLRMDQMRIHYPYLIPGLAYFQARLTQAPEDAAFALDYVSSRATSRTEQELVIGALQRKCEILWAQLDAIDYAYVVPGNIPPGCFVPTIDEKS